MARLPRRVLLVGLALAAGCLSPTLPLPPPAQPEVATVGQGLVELSGNVPEPNAEVFAANDTTELYAGSHADTTGAYRFRIGAEPGDPMRLWYVVGMEKSDTVAFAIPDNGLEVATLPTVTAPDVDGKVAVTGEVPVPLAVVSLRHIDRDETISDTADATGAYELTIAAESGDVLEFWYESGDAASTPMPFAVP
jgi:hypothetical protein